MSVYFNLALLENHMGYDSSWSYLKAALIWKEKSLISNVWVDQTSVFWDSSLILAALLYGVTNNLLVSYGISNIIILAGIIWCMVSIASVLKFNTAGKLICANLVICPYLVNGFNIINDLGYFNDVITGPAFYNVRALLLLMIIKSFLNIKSGEKFSICAILSLLLCIVAGISSGIFILVVLILPCLVFFMEKIFLENNLKVLKSPEAIYIYICAVIIYAGKIFGESVLGISAIDSSRTWTSIERIWTNIGSVVQGLMKLIGPLPVVDTSVEIMTDEGLYRIFPWAIFIIVIVAIIFGVATCVKNIKKVNEHVMLICTIVVCNFAVFGLFNAQYGSPVFEERYLICVYMAIILLVGYFITQLKKDLLISGALMWMLIIGIAGTDIVSNNEYMTTTNDEWQMNELLQYVEETNIPIVYFWGGEHVLTLGRAMRVYDLTRVYKCIDNTGEIHHWGDYVYYDYNESYDGPTLLVTSKKEDVVPEYVLKNYTLVKELNDVNIYTSSENPMDLAAGIYGDVSVDRPYTAGVETVNGDFENDGFVTDGTEGYVMYGPYVQTTDGCYNFTLYYEYLEGSQDSALFDIAIDVGTKVLGKVELTPDQNKVTIENVRMEEGHEMEYRVYCEEGVEIKIQKVVIEKVEE